MESLCGPFFAQQGKSPLPALSVAMGRPRASLGEGRPTQNKRGSYFGNSVSTLPFMMREMTICLRIA